MSISPETLASLRSASVNPGGIDAYANSVVVRPTRCACDYGNCTDKVAAVVMVTSGGTFPTVEVRTSCERHIDRMHEGWANKQVAVVRVGRS
jgi:hypothetical protein